MDGLTLKERLDRIDKEASSDSSRFLRELKKILKDAEKVEDIYLLGRVNLYLSACYFDLGIRTKILPHAVKAVNIFMDFNDQDMLARSYNLQGIAHLAQGNYQLAIASYSKALETIRGRRKPGIRKYVMLNNIAECYYLMGEYRKGMRLMKECLGVIRTKIPGDHISAVIYGINLSNDYEGLGEYQKSVDVLDSLKPDVEVLKREVLIWGYYARRCCALYMLGNLEEAAQYADLAIDSVNNGYDSYEFHRDFEKIVAEEIKIGDFKRAQGFADILTKYADENGHTIDLIVSKRVQAKICYAMGDHSRALSLYRELNGLYEKRIREENAMQYESQKNAEAASREITKLLKKVRDSEDRAERDPLTGLLNRSALVSITTEFLQNATQHGKHLGAVFLDIDYFKEYNDTYGHAAGDEAIKFIAKFCMGEENENIRFFRYGGDEYFGIVLDHSDEELAALALRLSNNIRSSRFEHVKNPNGQRLTVSIGIVNVNMGESKETILDIIKYADKALYHAKDRGKDDVFAYHAMANTEHEYIRIEDANEKF